MDNKHAMDIIRSSEKRKPWIFIRVFLKVIVNDYNHEGKPDLEQRDQEKKANKKLLEGKVNIQIFLIHIILMAYILIHQFSILLLIYFIRIYITFLHL